MEASESDDIVKEFLVESYENLDQLEQDLVELESGDDSTVAIARIFRTIHTVKGTCGFLGFSHLEHVTHVAENLLSRLRDKKLEPTTEISNALLATVDAVRTMLSCVEQTGSDGDSDYADLVATLGVLQSPTSTPVQAAHAQAAPPQAAPPQADASPAARAVTRHPPAEPTFPERPDAPLGELLISRGQASTQAVQSALEAQSLGDPRQVGEILVSEGAVAPSDVASAIKTQQRARAVVADTTIRVDVGLLDELMNLVGELVLARNQILQFAASQADGTFVSTAQRLNHVTSELQESVMKTRMQPIDTVWAKFPRLVRDVAQTCGKQIQIEMEGRDTELDRTLIEAIRDPLTHLVRNSIDHGVETPERRVKNGKSAIGTLRLRAFHEGGRVNIEISDDGGGIDPIKVTRRALDSQLITPEDARRLSENEILNLIFKPGFSTADKVTSISGRGVGMDVVKTNIERIGGSVDLESTLGKGTTIRLKIPLTLAIIPALIIGDGGERFAIPQVNLVELVYLEGERAKNAIEYVHGAPVYRLRGNLLPIVSLKNELSGKTSHKLFESESEASVFNIIVVQADDRQFGLIVSNIHDTEEIVVKPLTKHLKALNVYSGATIMGDGKVALILDVIGLAQRSRVLSKARDRSRKSAAVSVASGPAKPRESLLLVGLGEDRTLAIPLAYVARLEEVPASRIERAGPRRVVQYRGNIMPLIELADDLDVPSAPLDPNDPNCTRPVVVFTRGEQSIGLLVERIVDIVEEAVQPNRALRRPGISGSAIVGGRVVELVDVAAILGDYLPELAGTALEICA